MSSVILPPELQHLIFEHTASLGGFKVALKLMLVSRAVHDLIKPTQYRIFKQISWGQSFPDFDSALDPHPSSSSTPSLSTLGAYAHQLIIGGPDCARITQLIAACPNTTNLAVWSSCAFGLVLPAVEGLRGLQRLSADLETLTGDEIRTSRVLDRLRYLDIIGFRGPTWAEWSVLVSLPNLTHMMLNNAISIGIIKNLLSSCPALQILILLDDFDYTWDDAVSDIQDARLVLMNEPKNVDIYGDWVNGAEGKLDMWSFADLVSFARRRMGQEAVSLVRTAE